MTAEAMGAAMSWTLSQWVRGDAFAGDVEHLLGGVDADDCPGGADLVRQLGHAQPGATAHVQDRVTALDG
jgi:hypothetical protein